MYKRQLINGGQRGVVGDDHAEDVPHQDQRDLRGGDHGRDRNHVPDRPRRETPLLDQQQEPARPLDDQQRQVVGQRVPHRDRDQRRRHVQPPRRLPHREQHTPADQRQRPGRVDLGMPGPLHEPGPRRRPGRAVEDGRPPPDRQERRQGHRAARDRRRQATQRTPPADRAETPGERGVHLEAVAPREPLLAPQHGHRELGDRVPEQAATDHHRIGPARRHQLEPDEREQPEHRRPHAEPATRPQAATRRQPATRPQSGAREPQQPEHRPQRIDRPPHRPEDHAERHQPDPQPHEQRVRRRIRRLPRPGQRIPHEIKAEQKNNCPRYGDPAARPHPANRAPAEPRSRPHHGRYQKGQDHRGGAGLQHQVQGEREIGGTADTVSEQAHFTSSCSSSVSGWASTSNSPDCDATNTMHIGWPGCTAYSRS